MLIDHADIKKAVIRSQHCQRNFDLEKLMPEEDIDLLIHAATNCPSKQNISFYNLYVITNRDIIDKIHELSIGAAAFELESKKEVVTTNSQIKANVLFVYERKTLNDMSEKHINKWKWFEDSNSTVFERDVNTSIGISAGYVNVIASMLDYATGCCQCFQVEEIRELLNLKRTPELIMGIGYNNDSKNRRLHATDPALMFYTNKKEDIVVNRLD